MIKVANSALQKDYAKYVSQDSFCYLIKVVDKSALLDILDISVLIIVICVMMDVFSVNLENSAAYARLS